MNTLSINQRNHLYYVTFVEDLRRVLDHPWTQRTQRYGQASEPEHTVDFHILTTESGWGEMALRGVFIHGLSEAVKV